MCLQCEGDELVKTRRKHPATVRRASYLHQRHGLFAPHALLVDEYQNADDGTDEAETSHQAGYDERRVHGHRHQLAAALAVVVPVFPYGAPETHKEMSEQRSRRPGSHGVCVCTCRWLRALGLSRRSLRSSSSRAAWRRCSGRAGRPRLCSPDRTDTRPRCSSGSPRSGKTRCRPGTYRGLPGRLKPDREDVTAAGDGNTSLRGSRLTEVDQGHARQTTAERGGRPPV